MNAIEILDKEIRYFIYKIFGETTKPPTTEEVSKFYDLTITQAEESYKRLASAHQIALAPGSFSIWMAHPFSALPTNFTAYIEPNKYFAN